MHNYVHHRSKLPVIFSAYFEENKVINKYYMNITAIEKCKLNWFTLLNSSDIHILIWCGYIEVVGSPMEFVPLESSNIANDDAVLNEIKQEIEDEVWQLWSVIICLYQSENWLLVTCPFTCYTFSDKHLSHLCRAPCGLRVVRMDPLCFLAGYRTRWLNQVSFCFIS